MLKTAGKPITIGLVYLLSNSLSKVFGFCFNAVTSSYLGATYFGLISLAQSVVGIGTAISLGGFQASIQRFLVSEDSSKTSGKYTVVYVSSLLLSGASSLVLFSFASEITMHFFGDIRLVYPVKILALSIPFSVFTQLFIAVFKSKFKSHLVVITQLLLGLSAILAIYLTIFTVGFFRELTWYILAKEVIVFVLAGYLLLRLNIKTTSFHVVQAKEVFAYSIPLAFISIGYFIQGSIGRFLTGYYTDSKQVGIFSVAFSIAMVLEVPHISFASIFKPLCAKYFDANKLDAVKFHYCSINTFVGALNGMALLLILLFGHTILNFFGNDYSGNQSYQTLIILSGYAYLTTWSGQCNGLLQMTGKEKVELWNTIFAVFCITLFSYFLTNLFGIRGIAWAILMGGVVKVLLQLYQSFRLFKSAPFWSVHLLSLILALGCVVVSYTQTTTFATTIFLIISFLLFTILLGYLTFYLKIIKTFSLSGPKEKVEK